MHPSGAIIGDNRGKKLPGTERAVTGNEYKNRGERIEKKKI